MCLHGPVPGTSGSSSTLRSWSGFASGWCTLICVNGSGVFTFLEDFKLGLSISMLTRPTSCAQAFASMGGRLLSLMAVVRTAETSCVQWNSDPHVHALCAGHPSKSTDIAQLPPLRDEHEDYDAVTTLRTAISLTFFQSICVTASSGATNLAHTALDGCLELPHHCPTARLQTFFDRSSRPSSASLAACPTDAMCALLRNQVQCANQLLNCYVAHLHAG